MPDAIYSGPRTRQIPEDLRSNTGRVVAKPKYGPGSLFAVPLNDGGYGLGLVARMSSKGILLGYFFAPKWAQVPSLPEVKSLSPNDSVLIGRFSSLGLKQGTWEVLGSVLGWVPEEWPMPVFAREGTDYWPVNSGALRRLRPQLALGRGDSPWWRQ